MRTQLTRATLRRELRNNFFAYVDYTLRWQSNGLEMLDDDPTLQLVEAIHNYRDWDVCRCLFPRGVGKTTIEVLGQTWKKWRHVTWLMQLLISATPDVTRDAYEYCLTLCREHPLLDELRPGLRDSQRKDINTKHRRGKGRCFRYRTMGTRITGGRAHEVDIDDMEVLETVSSAGQREKMLLVLAEVQNLHIKGHWYCKDLIVGTPWDYDTIMRAKNMMENDLQIECPAWIGGEFGEEGTTYPFKRLPEGDLRRIKFRLNNDPLFNSQYGLDTTRDEDAMPIRSDQILFKQFKAISIEEVFMLLDPAGGKSSAEDRALMRVGQRRGDGMGILVGGVRYDELRILDIFADPCGTTAYLDKICEWCLRYGVTEIRVESNFNAYRDLVRLRMEERNLHIWVDDFHTDENKLRKVLDNVPPLTGLGMLIFHERLRENDKLRDQLLGLRYHSLPKPNDEVVDMLAMLANQLSEYLRPILDKKADEMAQMKARLVPGTVIESSRIIEERERRLRGGRDQVGTIIENEWD